MRPSLRAAKRQHAVAAAAAALRNTSPADLASCSGHFPYHMPYSLLPPGQLRPNLLSVPYRAREAIMSRPACGSASEEAVAWMYAAGATRVKFQSLADPTTTWTFL